MLDCTCEAGFTSLHSVQELLWAWYRVSSLVCKQAAINELVISCSYMTGHQPSQGKMNGWSSQCFASSQDWILLQMAQSCALGCHDQKSSFQKIDFHPSLPAFPQLKVNTGRRIMNKTKQWHSTEVKTTRDSMSGMHCACGRNCGEEEEVTWGKLINQMLQIFGPKSKQWSILGQSYDRASCCLGGWGGGHFGRDEEY